MSVPRQQAIGLDEIKGMLLAQRRQVALRYAPTANGAYEDGGDWWTLNPGRADRKVGSFVVHIDGPRQGRWQDFATSQHGDLLDLIALNLGCTLADALREARLFLGLQADRPEDTERRRLAARRAEALAAEARAKGAAEKERRKRAGLALWLSARERIRGTPVEYYLRDARSIDLAALGRQPRALRYHPACNYRDIDGETGEVVESVWPAMLALVTNARGEAVACHRTWLAIGADGRWAKAPVPKAKKVLGDYAGASIHLWSGMGPRGGKGVRLAEAPPGSHLFIAEGIETALSAVVLVPDARVLAAISLSNMGGIALPETITDITLIADGDDAPAAQAALERAVAEHARAGRRVCRWRGLPGQDLNDALKARMTKGADNAGSGFGSGGGSGAVASA